ncbi:MAG TPA: carboxypeptidase regulatory-like domain-containing protein, partial [Candidatus Acidoferrum sp.]|nr:carboxypeptidase regulatory-like domain-containing protein [Candidatus Acidoferrum sp.]
QQLSEPYYSRRPVVPLPESVQLSPQTHAATLSGGNGRLSGAITDTNGATIPAASVRLLDENGTQIASTITDSSGNYSFSSLPVGNYRLESQRSGFKTSVVSNFAVSPGENQLNSQLQVGTSAETVTVTATTSSVDTSSAEISGNGGIIPGVANRAHVYNKIPPSPPPPAQSAANLDAAREMSFSAARGQDLGDLFEYKLKDRVTLGKNQSALVPIAQTDIEAQKVSLWSGTSGSGRPLRALWIKNTSPLTLDAGSFSVLESEVFAGEGLTDPIKPGDRRLLSYATDLGLLVEAVTTAQPQRVTRIKISKGVMTQSSELHEHTLYTVRSQDDSPRTLVIEHPARVGSTLAKGNKEPEETAPGTFRFKLEISPKATASLPVEEVRILQNSFQLTNLDEDQIAVFIKNGSVSPNVAEALKKVAAQKAAVAKLETEMENRQKDIDRIVADQARLRENMKALKGSAEEKGLVQRYTRELDQQETELDSLRKTIQDTEFQRDKANNVLDDMIGNLDLDATV